MHFLDSVFITLSAIPPGNDGKGKSSLHNKLQSISYIQYCSIVQYILYCWVTILLRYFNLESEIWKAVFENVTPFQHHHSFYCADVDQADSCTFQILAFCSTLFFKCFRDGRQPQWKTTLTLFRSGFDNYLEYILKITWNIFYAI